MQLEAAPKAQTPPSKSTKACIKPWIPGGGSHKSFHNAARSMQPSTRSPPPPAATKEAAQAKAKVSSAIENTSPKSSTISTPAKTEPLKEKLASGESTATEEEKEGLLPEREETPLGDESTETNAVLEEIVVEPSDEGSYQMVEKEEAVEVERNERAAAVAAAAEQERAAKAATEAELRAAELSSEASEVEFHAQILQNRAQNLLRESNEMNAVAVAKKKEADQIAATIADAVAEFQTLEAKSSKVREIVRDLPGHIIQCKSEIAILSRRIQALEEEVIWAQGEIESNEDEAEKWEGLLNGREMDLRRLRVQEADAREAVLLAYARAAEIAAEAKAPTLLAEEKFKEAAELKKRAANAVGAAEEAVEEKVVADMVKKEAVAAAVVEVDNTLAIEEEGNGEAGKGNGAIKHYELDQMHPMYACLELIEAPPPGPVAAGV